MMLIPIKLTLSIYYMYLFRSAGQTRDLWLHPWQTDQKGHQGVVAVQLEGGQPPRHPALVQGRRPDRQLLQEPGMEIYEF